MKVLSLFDGMSCGQIALSKLGIKVDKYYASEIDKYAIQITQKNFPDTVQLGDICELDPKDFKDVDLILAGSPCQGFSFAGKQLAFDDPRSALFFEFIRLLKEIKPKYFLLENVRMKKEFLEVITEQVSACYTADDVASEYKDIFGAVKFEPHFINSSLLSAQSRQRYYWTNIPNIKQPEDKGIVLRDVLEYNPQDPTLMSENFVTRQIKNEKDGCLITEGKEKASNLSAEEYVKNGRQGDYLACDDDGKPIADMVGQNGKKLIKENLDKAMTITARDYKGFSGRGSTGVRVDSPKRIGTADNIKGHDILKRVYSEDGKSPTITAHAAQGSVPKIETKPKKAYDIPREILKDNERQRRVYDPSGKSPTILGRSDSPKITTPKQVGVAVDIKGHDILKRVYSPEGKSPTINAHSGGNTEPKVAVQSYREVRTDEAKKARKEARQKTGKDHTPFRAKKLEPRDDGKVGTVTPSLNKDHEISMIREKSKTVRSGGRGSYDRHEWDSVDEMHWRKLTPLECERLQTVPDGYTEGVSNTQRYRMLGNGWTVDVIAHILTNMEK